MLNRGISASIFGNSLLISGTLAIAPLVATSILLLYLDEKAYLEYVSLFVAGNFISTFIGFQIQGKILVDFQKNKIRTNNILIGQIYINILYGFFLFLISAPLIKAYLGFSYYQILVIGFYSASIYFFSCLSNILNKLEQYSKLRNLTVIYSLSIILFTFIMVIYTSSSISRIVATTCAFIILYAIAGRSVLKIQKNIPFKFELTSYQLTLMIHVGALYFVSHFDKIFVANMQNEVDAFQYIIAAQMSSSSIFFTSIVNRVYLPKIIDHEANYFSKIDLSIKVFILQFVGSFFIIWIYFIIMNLPLKGLTIISLLLSLNISLHGVYSVLVNYLHREKLNGAILRASIIPAIIYCTLLYYFGVSNVYNICFVMIIVSLTKLLFVIFGTNAIDKENTGHV